MDVNCEGTLLVPPDRGTIIGRAIWKVSLLILPLPGVEINDEYAASICCTGATKSPRACSSSLRLIKQIDEWTQERKISLVKA
jgi:hypothetical protein